MNAIYSYKLGILLSIMFKEFIMHSVTLDGLYIELYRMNEKLLWAQFDSMGNFQDGEFYTTDFTKLPVEFGLSLRELHKLNIKLPDTNVICESFKDFFQDRVVPETRTSIREILNWWNIKHYDIIEIMKAIHGVSLDDYYWVKFDKNDKTTFKDLDSQIHPWLYSEGND